MPCLGPTNCATAGRFEGTGLGIEPRQPAVFRNSNGAEPWATFRRISLTQRGLNTRKAPLPSLGPPTCPTTAQFRATKVSMDRGEFPLALTKALLALPSRGP